VSPINEQNRALAAALSAAFATGGIDLPVYWGNRNSQPWLADTVEKMTADGVTRGLVLATSATGGYSGCRQYRENLRDARASLDIDLVKLRHFFNHPGFIAANADRVNQALSELPDRASARLVFTAHSIPVAMNDAAGPDGGLYLAQQRETARLVAESVRGAGAPFDLVWQSRSGPARVAWLEPDVNDHLRSLAADGVTSVVVSPTGFISDHLEVLWDLDNEARETATELGMTMARAGTVGTHPLFVQAICDLVRERLVGAERQALGPMGPSWDECPFEEGCCTARSER
jgi:ferrochelatase